MCGILGIRCFDTELGVMIFDELLKESQIRGKHATGVSYYVNGKIETEIKPIPAKKFVDITEIPESEYIIGHVRYSTSDLNYNQPIQNNKISIVHNGVVTQEAPEKWEEHFKFDNFKTRNDSELILKCLSSDNIFKRKTLFSTFPNASIACGVLKNGSMSCFRNLTRPLWIFESTCLIDGHPLFSGFASTKSIINRTFTNLDVDVVIKATEPFTEYSFNSDGTISENSMTKGGDNKYKLDQQITSKKQSKHYV